MKILFVLLLIWASFTIILGLDNLKLQQQAEDKIQHRAFIVYYNTFVGCLHGAVLTTGEWQPSYMACFDYAYKAKKEYLKR